MPDHAVPDLTDGLSGEGYFDLAWYERLWRLIKSWRELGEIPEERLPSAADAAACTRLLHLEARLLDQERLEEWLALFTEDAAYWIPSDVELRDPRKTVSWELNDRRRLEERVERLATGTAYSQAPPTRLTHLYTNIEAMQAGPDAMHILCNFLIHTNFQGRVSQRAGWNGYVLRRVGAKWRIVLKRVSLFDADHPQNNNSFTL
jgi:benzoate/toluate 1,2-dioxygenase beta subunit